MNAPEAKPELDGADSSPDRLILPGAGRVWKAVTKVPDGYLPYNDIMYVVNRLHIMPPNFDAWQRLLDTTR